MHKTGPRACPEAVASSPDKKLNKFHKFRLAAGKPTLATRGLGKGLRNRDAKSD